MEAKAACPPDPSVQSLICWTSSSSKAARLAYELSRNFLMVFKSLILSNRYRPTILGTKGAGSSPDLLKQMAACWKTCGIEQASNAQQHLPSWQIEAPYWCSIEQAHTFYQIRSQCCQKHCQMPTHTIPNQVNFGARDMLRKNHLLNKLNGLVHPPKQTKEFAPAACELELTKI